MAMNKKSDFAKWRQCFRGVNVAALIGLVLLCGQLFLLKCVEQGRLGLDSWYRIHQSLSVLLALVSGIAFVLCLRMMRYGKCPYCGKSVLSKKWWNYERIRKIRKCQSILCPHCGKEIETE